MDVVFVNRMLGMTRGGGEIWDLRMAENLEELGVGVTFYVGEPVFGELSDPIEGFDSVTVPTPHLRNMAYAAPKGFAGALYDLDTALFRRRVVSELDERDHDIIHVNSDPQFGRYADRFDQPVVVKMNGPPHSLWQDYLSPFADSYDFFEKFDAVVATGVTTEKIEARTDVDVHTINPGVDTDHFTPGDYDEATEGKTILFVGRFVPAKDIPTLLEVFDGVRDAHPDAELVLVGDGPRRNRIESKIDDLGLGDAVRLLGYVDNKELPAFYRRTDVFALSSKHESFGIVLLEAMSCGTPVVAPCVDWIPNIVDHEREGLLWETKEEFEAHLDSLLSDPDLRETFGKRGRQKAVDGFDWRQRTERLHSVYENVIAQVGVSKTND